MADFLKRHPERSVAIDGYAGAVKEYLIRRDIDASRLTARGSAEALNREDVAIEQRSLRRVEVIIEDASSSVPQPNVTTLQP